MSDLSRPDDAPAASSATPVAVDDYLGEFHVYEPHKAGLPPLKEYFKELWRRREFAIEMSRAQIRAQNSDTVFGVLWNVLNPLLLAVVYYLLVSVLSGGHKERTTSRTSSRACSPSTSSPAAWLAARRP